MNNDIIKYELGLRIKELMNTEQSEISFLELLDIAYSTTKANGFKIRDFIKQLLFIGTEIDEALDELIIDKSNTSPELLNYVAIIQTTMKQIEQDRKEKQLKEFSILNNKEHFIEEIYDIIIRCFSILGYLEADLSILLKKMFINTQRPYLHGKKD